MVALPKFALLLAFTNALLALPVHVEKLVLPTDVNVEAELDLIFRKNWFEFHTMETEPPRTPDDALKECR